MDKMKLGLIGLGYIGKVHLLNCLKLKSVELVAASDISKKALNLAKKMGVKKTYDDYEQLLNDDAVDAVIIALPTHLHACCAKKAADAGKHIFLEKPLARNVAEGKDVLSAIRKNGIKLMVGYPYRFFSRFQALKQKVESGELGEVQIAYAVNIASGPFFHRAEKDIPRPVPDWWFKRELTGGGALMDLGSHMINLVRWYLGEVSNVKSHMGYRFNLDFEDHATCVFNFQSGQVSVVNTGWFSQQTERKVELFGTVAHASAAYIPSNKVKTALQLITRRTPTFYIPYVRELQHFVQCLKQDLPPSSSAEDALKDLEAIELAYKNQIRLD
jgi:predicted dehydrogenase